MQTNILILRLMSKMKINLNGLKKDINHFNRLEKRADTEEYSIVITSMSEMRRVLDSAILSIKSLIEPTHNKYIKNYEEIYHKFIDNLGRYNQKMDEEIDAIIRNEIGTQKLKIFRIHNMIDELRLAIKHLILFPMSNAYGKYNVFPENIELNGDNYSVTKNEDLFSYLLFLEMLRTSEVLGNLSRFIKPSSRTSSANTVRYENSPPETPGNMELTQETPEGIKTYDFSELTGGSNIENV